MNPLLIVQTAIIACYVGMIYVGWRFVRSVRELISIIRECKTTLELAKSLEPVKPMLPGQLEKENGLHTEDPKRV